ncbi:MAG: ribonuclease T [Novosphingobium sp.]
MRGASVLLAALAASHAPVRAQPFQCRPPATVAPLRAEAPDGPVRRVATVGYTLALSWSPEFCRTRARDRAHEAQCAGRMGRFGFIVHGLWPEGAADWPQWCRRVAPPPLATVRAQLCRTPSPALIGHAWAKHGSCMARAPADYFKVSNLLADSLSYPDLERLSREPGLTAGMLRTAFAAANPGRPAASFGLLASRTGWLREVRVCLDRRFRPVRCAAAQRGPADAAPLKVWRGL